MDNELWSQEEAGISAPLQHWGFLYFQSKGHAYAHRIDVYRAYDWSGEPTEYVGSRRMILNHLPNTPVLPQDGRNEARMV